MKSTNVCDTLWGTISKMNGPRKLQSKYNDGYSNTSLRLDCGQDRY